MKFLFIDDNPVWLDAIERYFRDNPNVIFAECHTVKEALAAITKHRPDVIFLDHSLTEGGGEGLEIAKQIKGVKIYSTTADPSVLPAYQKLGIEHVDKWDLKKMKSLVARKPIKQKN